MRKDDSGSNPDSINPMGETEGPDFFLMASRRLREIGFRFSTERDSNLIHFTKEVFKPDVPGNVRGSLKVSYRLESPNFNEISHKKEVLKKKQFLELVLNNELSISDSLNENSILSL
jgi:hypothetical protein